MKLFDKIRGLFGKSREKTTETEQPYRIAFYKNGVEYFAFMSDQQDLFTINYVMKMFHLYDRYKIITDVDKRRIEVCFTVKKGEELTEGN